jgi:hypothetical protein
MMKASKASVFLENMTIVPETAAAVPPTANEKGVTASGKLPATRQGLKHIGGYLGRDAVEKVAVLRARLGLDNSELLTLAINELYSRQQAKRAFDDR